MIKQARRFLAEALPSSLVAAATLAFLGLIVTGAI